MHFIEHIILLIVHMIQMVFLNASPGTEAVDDHLPEALLDGSVQVCGVQRSITSHDPHLAIAGANVLTS